MATATQCKNFIAAIAPIIQKYAKQYGYKVASPIIAQACNESGYGTSGLSAKYHNYFGMKCGSSWKGKAVNLSTKEEYKVGTLTSITAAFRVYDSMEEGVKGYFDFISAKRYQNLKGATSAAEYLELIKADGYATSSKYVQNNLAVVTKYNLTQYDNLGAIAEEQPTAAGNQGGDVNLRHVVVSNCYYLNCRASAVNGAVKGIFAKDTILALINKSGSWWEVSGKGVDGQTVKGFCSAKYLREV